MAFDGIVTKSICSELSNLTEAKITKIYEPNKNNITLGMYLNGNNYCLNICIDSSNYRIHLTTKPKTNPKIAPNFCMVLRKNLLGLHFKKIYTLGLERIVIIEFEGLDEIDDIINKKLIIELMGKHSNVILLDDENIIIDSLRHIKSDSDKFRDILPHTRYLFPASSKLNFLELKNFNDFYNIIHPLISENPSKVEKIISSTFTGISKSFISSITKNISYQKNDENYLKQIYESILGILTSTNLSFSTIYKENIAKDYYITKIPPDSSLIYPLNFYIDDFYYDKETNENFNNYKNSLLKNVINISNKYQKRLCNINKKLLDCESMEKYKIFGELITANLYKFNTNLKTDKITVINYYNNKELEIMLDTRFSISENAKKYYKKYNKLKNQLEIVAIQKNETEQELNYIQSIIYELDNAKNISELHEINSEITENLVIQAKNKNNSKKNKQKTSKLTSTKKLSFNPIKCNIDGYTVLIGRNNKENDYLTLKYANKSDIWFHVKDFHGSHVILKFLNENNHTLNKSTNILDMIPQELLKKVSNLAISHSKAKLSTNTPVDYCEVRFVKKPKGNKPGMVIYTNYRTI